MLMSYRRCCGALPGMSMILLPGKLRQKKDLLGRTGRKSGSHIYGSGCLPVKHRLVAVFRVLMQLQVYQLRPSAQRD